MIFIDIDECLEGTNGCTQNCHNNIGSYTCSCHIGYRLAADQRTCIGERAPVTHLRIATFQLSYTLSLQMSMSVLRTRMGVARTVKTLSAPTSAAVTLDTGSIRTTIPAMVH